MKEIIEFVSSSIVEGVVGDIVYDSLKAILGSSFDTLSKHIKNNKNERFEGALEMLLEKDSQLKEDIKRLMTEYKTKGDKTTTYHQTHYGEGDIVGRDKVVHNHPK